jgi:hypothetical protein
MNFKEYFRENAGRYYSDLLATKIVDKIDVFIGSNVSKTDLIGIVSEVIQKHNGVK